MKRYVFLFVILLVVSAVASVPLLYIDAQEQHAKTARDRVERLLRDKSSSLSRSMANRVGDYELVEIDDVYPHVIWRRAMVYGHLTGGKKRYRFMVIDHNGSLKIEYILMLRDGSDYEGEVIE